MKRTLRTLSGIAAAVTALFLGCNPPVTPEKTGMVKFSPAAGTFNYGPTVTLTSDKPNAAVYYTLDGSVPSAASTRYTKPFAIKGEHRKSITVSARTISGGRASGVSTAVYKLDYSRFPALAGSITTGSGVDIAKVKVGLFFKGHKDGPNPAVNIHLSDDVDNTVPSGRLYYDDPKTADGTAVQVTPMRMGHVETAKSTYLLPLPSPPPKRGVEGTKKWSEGFYSAAWYDSDGDGVLDLKDGPVNTQAADGEYNRLATGTVMHKGVSTAVYLDFLEQSETVVTDYQFKYYQVGNDGTYGHIRLNKSNADDFSFAISAVRDTN